MRIMGEGWREEGAVFNRPLHQEVCYGPKRLPDMIYGVISY